MTRKICRFFWVLSFFVALGEANGQVKIVSSLSDYASIAESIGGEKVEVTSIAKGYQDAHFVKAKPSFARRMSEADLFLTTGMDLELWVPTPPRNHIKTFMNIGTRTSRYGSDVRGLRFDSGIV